MVGMDEEVLDRHVGKESLYSYFSGTQNGSTSHSCLHACSENCHITVDGTLLWMDHVTTHPSLSLSPVSLAYFAGPLD